MDLGPGVEGPAALEVRLEPLAERLGLVVVQVFGLGVRLRARVQQRDLDLVVAIPPAMNITDVAMTMATSVSRLAMSSTLSLKLCSALSTSSRPWPRMASARRSASSRVGSMSPRASPRDGIAQQPPALLTGPSRQL